MRLTFPADPRRDPELQTFVNAGVTLLKERGLTLATDRKDPAPGLKWWVVPECCETAAALTVAFETTREARLN
ncbi:MAG TPA: hypothetical protein VM925_21745 [Labilithrix sp.]|nr:hypothetical protein [Labilithrix sp.]